jgi:selenocysteine lyase/cysteine desulfurase
MPVKDIVKAVRERATKEGVEKCEVCVDCVAYAPHRRIDVQEWDVDFCYFSFYKVSPRATIYKVRIV